jgi:hypothetical protein
VRYGDLMVAPRASNSRVRARMLLRTADRVIGFERAPPTRCLGETKSATCDAGRPAGDAASISRGRLCFVWRPRIGCCEALDYAALGNPPPRASSDHAFQFNF